ncbi:adenylate/guanylate cyclase domain-containing protein [Massilia niastensis]|uniref:adenylate/guanylate cyclase domain-containing protein n=1 Tax=Massilia niastensis TaxID=544911 RepID=UPI001E524170|nr:adenylate/guanylate cyclase domain-containing protein [Massilia niastensis]
MDEILAGEDASYEDHKGIPSRDNLTFTNGFYVDVTVMFIDMRGSKKLAEKHTRPVLAKVYRAYISEMVAVLKDNSCINEVYIEGDGVWAVFNTTTKPEVQSVVDTAARVKSLADVLNVKLKRRAYSEIKIGVGIEDGESLYIKAGYKGSSINEVVWIGRSVGSAAKMCGFGNATESDKTVMASKRVYEMLDGTYKNLFVWSSSRECYMGNFHNRAMQKWVVDNE